MHRGEKKFFKDINATDDGISLKENGGEDNLPFPFEDNHSFHFNNGSEFRLQKKVCARDEA